jgi:hypothetical protein
MQIVFLSSDVTDFLLSFGLRPLAFGFVYLITQDNFLSFTEMVSENVESEINLLND